ncbi:hypothetical protein NDU88_002152 [Pleurodeles waltl]|uniref:Uncharacterized protein n=1 Tax=Pleurodeles waltl TaxID=8319 RepID=A0AAV7TKD7_PLEWA|nr:hypothetical protein NDU88_002152 [Pleurodeles waltl]
MMSPRPTTPATVPLDSPLIRSTVKNPVEPELPASDGSEVRHRRRSFACVAQCCQGATEKHIENHVLWHSGPVYILRESLFDFMIPGLNLWVTTQTLIRLRSSCGVPVP